MYFLYLYVMVIAFFPFSLTTRRFVKSLSIVIQEMIFLRQVTELTSSVTSSYVVFSAFNERQFSIETDPSLIPVESELSFIVGKTYILALLTCWELLGRFQSNFIALESLYRMQTLKKIVTFNDSIISLASARWWWWWKSFL